MNQFFTSNITNELMYDFKHSENIFDYEYALHNEQKERVIRDIATDTFVKEVFSDSRITNKSEEVTRNNQREKNRFNFLTYVYNYLRFKIETELPQMLCNQNIVLAKGENVYLIFKGGSMMYYLYEQLLSNLTNPAHFRESFDDRFKISDFDFTIYITVKDPKIFYKVKLLVNKIVHRGLIDIRDFFEDYINNIFDENIENNLLGTIDALEESILKNCLLLTTDRNTKILSLTMIESLINELNSILIIEQTHKTKQQNLSETFFNQIETTLNEKKKNFLNNLLVIAEWLEQFNFFDIQSIISHNEFHFQKFLLIHKLITIFYHNLHKFSNNIVSKAISITYGDLHFAISQYKLDVYDVVQKVTFYFTKAIQRKIIQDKFYLIKDNSVIDHICNEVKEEFKKKDIKFIKTPYDDYLAFQDDTNAMKDNNNFKQFTLQKEDSISVTPEKREDFYIQPNLLNSNIMYIQNKTENFHYVYQNSIIKKSRNAHSSIVDFDLLRIKYNFQLKHNGETFKIPSEFIDISICGYDDSSLDHFRKDTLHALKVYKIPYKNSQSNLTLECYGYSIDFTMHDLTYVLYSQNTFTPWIDGKYEKRIYRLTGLELLQRANTNTMDVYKNTLIFTYAITLYCLEFLTTRSDDIVSKTLNNIKETIKASYNKHNFNNISSMLPSILVVPVRQLLQNLNIDNSLPFSNEIIGSVVFYTCMIRLIKENKQNKTLVKKIINYYRNDFLYYNLDDNDFDKMIQSAENYLNNIENIYSNMLQMAKTQNAGGKKYKKLPSFY